MKNIQHWLCCLISSQQMTIRYLILLVQIVNYSQYLFSHSHRSLNKLLKSTVSQCLPVVTFSSPHSWSSSHPDTCLLSSRWLSALKWHPARGESDPHGRRRCWSRVATSSPGFSTGFASCVLAFNCIVSRSLPESVSKMAKNKTNRERGACKPEHTHTPLGKVGNCLGAPNSYNKCKYFWLIILEFVKVWVFLQCGIV